MKKLIVVFIMSILSFGYVQSQDTALPFPEKSEIVAEITGEVPAETPATEVNEVASPDAVDIPATEVNPIAEFFASITSLILLISIVTGWIIKTAKSSGTLSQIISWVVAFAVAFIGYWQQIGIFEGVDILKTAAIGLGAGLVTNRLFDAGTLDNLLKFFFAKKA